MAYNLNEESEKDKSQEQIEMNERIREILDIKDTEEPKETKRNVKSVLIGIIIGVILTGTSIFLGLSLTGNTMVGAEEYDALNGFATKYNNLFQTDYRLKNDYLGDNYDTEKIDTEFARTATESIGDPYSSFMNQEEYKEFTQTTSGTFYGVGIRFTMTDYKNGKGFRVETVNKNGGASKAGIKVGDIITKIDGKTYKSSDDARNAIIGDDGTKVRLTVARGTRVKTYTVIRSEVKEQTVSYKLNKDKTGYIYISGFKEDTADNFKAAISALREKGARGYVLDLRDNGGGLVSSSTEIADMLLEKGQKIVSTIDKNGNSDITTSTKSPYNISFVVLANENTASASEILIGAIKDNEAAKIVGNKTYGKGIVQSIFTFTNGCALKLTTMEYLTPKGIHIHGKGIEPDIKISLPKKSKEDVQLERAYKVLKDEINKK